jgi:GT2 family glycosyltransferase
MDPDSTAPRIAGVVVNHNTAELTIEAVASLLSEPGIGTVHVGDCGSGAADRGRLATGLAGFDRVRLTLWHENLGFALACNRLVQEALADRATTAVLLLNSDARLVAGGASVLATELANGSALAGGKIMRANEPEQIDSLGIALYASCLASDRKTSTARYLGPTACCALYGRALVEDLTSQHGHFMDPDFFCYAEDTDLALRAIGLGHFPGFVERTVAIHHGQASSGGSHGPFVLYHGIRNSIWLLAKSIPPPIVICCIPLIALMHGAILLRHLLKGDATTLRRLYGDAMAGWPAMWRKGRIVRSRRRVGLGAFFVRITPQFYDPAYIVRALRELRSGSRGRGLP